LPTLISLFEVPPADEEQFVAGWARGRSFVGDRAGEIGAVLHRSLSPQAQFRFVDVARIDAVPAWQAAVGDPAFPGRDMPGLAHRALYEVVEQDEPAEADGSDSAVVLVNAFEVSPDEDEAFLIAWNAARAAQRSRPGYLGTRLHRSLADDADFRFVNVAPFASREAFAESLRDPAFQAAAAAIAQRAHPMLYEPVGR
jgi:quinol monooxygenase YgiN